MASIVTFIKTFNKAFNIATSTVTQQRNLYLKEYSEEDRMQEDLDESWRRIGPKALDQEIKSSMVRNEIENLTFLVKILTKILGTYVDKMTNYNYYEENPYNPKDLQNFLKE